MTDEPKELTNGYGDFASGLMGNYNPFGGSQLSQTDTMFKNNRWYLISNFTQIPLSSLHA